MGIRNTSRTIARDNNEKFYEGRPCKNPDHINPETGTTTRLVSFNGCRACNSERWSKWKKQRQEHLDAYRALLGTD